MVVAIGIGYWSAAGRYSDVPTLVGLQRALAESKTHAAGLEVRYGTAKFDEKAPAGQVLSQNPAAGAQAPRSSVVTLVLSKGPERHAVPTVVGSTQANAEAAIRDATLTPQSSNSYSDSVAAGLVISSTPSAGTQLRSGVTVKLVISKGAKPADNPLCTPEFRRWERFLGQKICPDNNGGDGSNDGGDGNN
jgi:serine/threonine-protein kinase